MISESKPLKPKRRWLRFSLRSLLILMTILAIWFSLYVRVQKQRKAVAWIVENGGSIIFDNQWKLGTRSPVPSQSTIREFLTQFLDVHYFADVAGVTLADGQFEELTPLSELPNLEYLDLENNQVNDLKPITKITSLKVLYLNNTQVSDLTPIANLTKLEVLSLSDTKIDDLATLAHLPNLKKVYLRNLSLQELTPLAGLSNLEVLDLTSTQTSDEHIKKLQRALPNCKIIR